MRHDTPVTTSDLLTCLRYGRVLGCPKPQVRALEGKLEHRSNEVSTLLKVRQYGRTCVLLRLLIAVVLGTST